MAAGASTIINPVFAVGYSSKGTNWTWSSSAVGAIDAITLVYVAGITGYYGNANLNFS